MKKLILFLIAIILMTSRTSAQIGINTEGLQPDPSAGLDVKFNNKGFLPPRMTQAQRDAIQNPAEGLIIICTDCGFTDPATLSIYINGAWSLITCYCTTPAAPVAGTPVIMYTQITWNWNPVSGAVGFKWNITNNFSTATDMGTAITITETGLSCATEYSRYVWAYNACGISTALTLTQSTLDCGNCGQSFTDTRDGKNYNTVVIGMQCWMAQNLNTGTMIPGSTPQTNHSAIEKYCNNNDEAVCTVYGGLYQWDNMMQWSTTGGVQGICPSGWHIPTDGEWTILTTFLGGQNIAGDKLKEAGTTHWMVNSGATNSSGFTGLPGGGVFNGYFGSLTTDASFWSSSQYDASYAWYRGLHLTYGGVFIGYNDKTNGYSVRCILF